MVERSLVVIVGIAGIMSTALVSLFFHEGVVEPIEILRQDWNLPTENGRLLIPGQEGRFAYTLAIVARQSLAELKLAFAILVNDSREFNLTIGNGQNHLDAITDIPHMGDYLKTHLSYAEATQMGYCYSKIDVDEPVPGELHILDLTESISALTSQEELKGVPSIHAFLFFDDELHQHYHGFPDFFLLRDSAIVDLTIQVNDNLTKYSQRASPATGTVSMDLSPPNGILHFRDLKRDDRVSITIAFNPARLSLKSGLLQVVSIEVNAEPYRTLINLMERRSIDS
jgi:hypothetical protein